MSRIEFPRPYRWVTLFLVAASCLAAAEESLPAPRGVIARNADFEVVADDMLSAQYVATVGELLAKRFSRMLPPPRFAPAAVSVNLVPAAVYEGEGPFMVRIYSGGQVQVAISWAKSTSRATVERALAQGHLTSMAGAYSGGTVTVPLWLELALQHLARIQTVPSHGRFLAAQVGDGAMPLEAILSARRGDGVEADLAPFAYWLLIFLEQEGRGQGQLQNLLIRLFRGEAPLVAMNAAYGEHLRSASEAEMWWLVGLKELVHSPRSPLLPVGESRRRLMDFSRFTFNLEGGETRLFPEDLWEHRASARLEEELRHRGRVMRLALVSIHSYYYNSLLSLDRVFEAVLTADEEGFREALLTFRHDLRAGDELAADTAAVLDDLQAEMAQ